MIGDGLQRNLNYSKEGHKTDEKGGKRCPRGAKEAGNKTGALGGLPGGTKEGGALKRNLFTFL